MNKPITQEFKERAQKCVFDMNNRTNFYNSTGIHFSTVNRILERGYADDEQISAIEKYCDEVEGLTVHNNAD